MVRPDPVTTSAEQTTVLAVTTAARDITADLLRVVSECTGHPAERLTLDADLEADLGLNASKRAELLNAFRRALSAVESQSLGVATDALTHAHTLREFFTLVQAALGGTSSRTVASPLPQNEVELVRKATEVLGTNHVAHWMRSQVPSLGNQTPYTLLQTEDGRRQVERVLLKIEHGVY